MNSSYEINMKNLEVLTSKGGQMRIGISPKRCNSKHMIMGKVEMNPNETIVEHVHDYGEESMYIVEGKGKLIIEGEEFNLQPDYMYFVPQGNVHSIINDGDNSLIIIFSASPLAPNAKKGDRLISDNNCQPVLGMQILNDIAPDIFDGFRNLTSTIDDFSPIDLKYKELILIGIFTAYGTCRGIDTHTRIALQAGATIDQIMAAIIYALPISGITSVTQAIEIAQKAINDLNKC